MLTLILCKKKIGPSGLSSKRPGKLSLSGCSGDWGRNTLVPGLRRRTYTEGSATWCANVTRETIMATTIPFRVPTKTTPANATIAHENSGPIAMFLEGVQSVVVFFQWLHVVVVKPSHGKAICGEHHRAGHIEAETAVLYG
jgi:hypothetical protein